MENVSFGQKILAIEAKHKEHFKDGKISHHITKGCRRLDNGDFQFFHQIDSALPKFVYNEIVNTFQLEYPI
jgi:hypothetical protein